ncbi:MAG TPA: hypothetical protein VIW24_07285 [Aldersonia sp.]
MSQSPGGDGGLSADSDLAPAVRMARRVNPHLFIAAAFPPKRFSAELQNLMPRSFHLGMSKIVGGREKIPIGGHEDAR